jgi:hypothetical protein
MARKKKDALPVEESTLVTCTPAQDRLALKKKVRYFYDLQRMRLQASGRLHKRAEGTVIALHEYDLAVLERRAGDIEKLEESALKDVEDHLKRIPFYRDILTDKVRYRGIGPTMAGVLLAEYDITLLDTPSKAWAFAGLAPVPAYRCTKCHTVVSVEDAENGPQKFSHPVWADCNKKGVLTLADVYASGKTMKPTKGEKLPYNAFLKTKLVGVLGPVMLQVGKYRCIQCKGLVAQDKKISKKDKKVYCHTEEACAAGNALSSDDVVYSDRPPFVKFYEDYKHRKLCAGWGRSDAHRHQAALRYMIKMMLLQLWNDWRAHAGLPIRPSYQEEKLGHTHSGKQVLPAPISADEAAIEAEIAAEAERLEQAAG